MKFNEQDIDMEIKRAKLELIKITAGIASAVLIAIGVTAVATVTWLAWRVLG